MTVTYDLQNKIGVITINNPPVNALSQPVREGLKGTIEKAQHDDSELLIIICTGRTFMAGADISEFGKMPMEPSLPDVVNLIEASAKPVIAAIHGTALGGGFEVALACHYRIAVPSAKVGLPEVKLGLLPGAGGTQRAPRLAGVKNALDLITSGQPMKAARAQSIGLLDALVEGDLLTGAIEFANTLLADKPEVRRVGEITIAPAQIEPGLFDAYRARLAKRARGQIAPQKIVACVEAAVNQPINKGLELERKLFVECLLSPESQGLRHLFFAERKAAKINGLSKETRAKAIQSVGIIGGGTMGGGIAMNFANAGIPVTLLEIDEQALQRGKDIIASNYGITVNKGKLSEAEAEKRLGMIRGTTSYDDLAEVDLVIEAVFEDLAIKQTVFKQLDTVCKPGAILASNTSYQDIDAIAAVTRRPQDVIGLHFFSPANVMKLLEVVRGDKTSDEVLATAMDIAKQINKVPVLSRVCFGFIGNRMLRPYAREAQLCLIEGATPEQIDRVMENWGMAMGPLAVGDLAGIDIGYKARQGLSDEEKGDPKSYCIADRLVAMGRLGQKTGAGYYQYDPASRARSSDETIIRVIEEEATKQGVVRREISDDEILDRLTLALINEGFNILEEGIAQRSSDIDVVYIFGYGFPAYRGGPMAFAENRGLKKVYARICQFGEQFGQQNWTPSTLLKELATDNKSLAQWEKEQA